MSAPPPSDRSSGPSADTSSSFATAWDGYVDDARASGQDWPGDDWGDPALWDAWFARLVGDHGAAGWRRAVEVGQGTGKYTARLLDTAPDCRVLACDVSERFLELCRRRLASAVASGRLQTARIAERDPDGVLRAVESAGWTGSVDGVFAIDTLVHLTFTQVVAVMLAAARVLRDGGLLAFTFACGTSEAGRAKLLADLDRVIRDGGDPTTGCFHWISPDLVRTTAEALGFDVRICDVDPMHARDGHFVGTLVDREKAERAHALRAKA